MKDHLSRSEINKDAVQTAIETTASTVGQIAVILTTAVRDVATAIGDLATELFEQQDASRKARDEDL